MSDRDEKRQIRFEEERIRAESIKRQADKTGKLIIAYNCEITVADARTELDALLDSIDRDVASWGQVADDPLDIPAVAGWLRKLRARIEELEPLSDAAAHAIRTAIHLGDTYATGCLRRNAERGYKCETAPQKNVIPPDKWADRQRRAKQAMAEHKRQYPDHMKVKTRKEHVMKSLGLKSTRSLDKWLKGGAS